MHIYKCFSKSAKSPSAQEDTSYPGLREARAVPCTGAAIRPHEGAFAVPRAPPPPNDPARHGALTSSMWGGYYLQKKVGRAPSAHAERALAKQRHFQCHRPSVPGSQHYMGSRKNYYRKQPSRMVLSPVDLRRKQVASSVRREKETKKKRSGVQE